jgi:hypothetical protein
MWRSVKQLYGDKIGALDGEIGHVKDFYFDDQNWKVRYVVVDTGSWLTGRQVLISPRALGGLGEAEAGNVLLANLTRLQIEESPPIATHLPVSRQYEEEYHRYYGWPCYWQGDPMWGMSDVMMLEPPNPHAAKPPEPHLRSTLAINGCHLRATDGKIGHVRDFLLDDQTWRIGQLIVKIGPLLAGAEVLIPTTAANRVLYEESTITVQLTKEAVEKSPAYTPPPKNQTEPAAG